LLGLPDREPGDGDEAVRSASPGDPGEELRGDPVDLTRPGGGAFRSTGVFCCFWAVVQGVDGGRRGEELVVLPVAFDQDPAGDGILADGEQFADSRVLRADGQSIET
jgi:hypothetical protein